jgi:hypothetical protein
MKRSQKHASDPYSKSRRLGSHATPYVLKLIMSLCSLGLQCGPSIYRSETKFLVGSVLATCPAHLIPLYLIVMMLSDEE